MPASYDLGPFRLDPHAKVLSRDGTPAALGERGVTLLKVLVDHAQQYVPKAALMDAAWPRVIVEEGNLAVQISAIRRVLAEAGGQRWIETLPRRGYRYVGPLRRPRQLAARQPIALGNLPAYLTTFIGREREQVEIGQRLQDARLVTLVGAGGIGKTRLALQVAALAFSRHRDGVWLVELGSVLDPQRVAATVAQALGVAERGTQPLADTLGAHLAGRDLLLVLDNCEHVRAAAAGLAERLLRSTPHVRILATSREPLGIDGEDAYVLAPLSLPDTGAIERIARSDAVRLFVARAGSQQHDFALGERNAAAIARICTHLDGLPLALELAAARVRSLSVEQIVARLDDRFRLLAAGPEALPRHQTLRAALEWSYDLLAADERTVLRRLAVFAGSFSLASAMAVAADADLDDVAVVDVLERLVRRSLVAAVTADTFSTAATAAGAEGGTRYRLLETTRAYALAKLDDAGETRELRRRHARHFRERFDAAAAEWLHTADSLWWARYLPEHDNVCAALDWAFGAGGDAAIGIALVGTSNEIWKLRPARSEGRQWIEAALARVDLQTPAQQQALLWLRLATTLGPAEAQAACRALERAVALLRQADDRLGGFHAATYHASLLAVLGQLQPAQRMLAEARATLDAGVPPRLRLGHLEAVAMTEFLRGDTRAALAALEQALDVARAMGAERFTVFTLAHLADVHWTAGELDRAEACLREAIALATRLPRIADDVLSNCRANLIGVLVEKGQVDEPLSLARETDVYRTDPATAWQTMDHLALRALLADAPDAAARLTGYTDARHAQTKVPRQRNEQRARDRVDALLARHHSTAELATLRAEGAALGDAAACELALRG